MQDERSSELPIGFKYRQKIVARYLAILIAHEIIWESSFLTEIINFFDFFKGLLRVVKGNEKLTVAFIDFRSSISTSLIRIP